MKLTIIRLENFSDQDRIDLQKIWPEYSPSSLQVDDNHRIYAARFNERLLAAVRVTLSGTEGALDSLRVREVTRRRGVGQYLLEEVTPRFCVTILAFHVGGWRMLAWKIAA
ncbi:hypothetical protein EIMP300_15130 [Escherichia coli]|uniref:PanZ acetyltransferase (GNAT) domain-containing protein n=1 Tax=Escherichia coli TaxID=562 RepID=A0A8S0FHL4_ECOLX|nr:hypothetical protein EIMP300_15130 [Escherichia coli]